MDGISGAHALMSRIQLTVLRKALDMSAAQAGQVLQLAESLDTSCGKLVDCKV